MRPSSLRHLMRTPRLAAALPRRRNRDGGTGWYRKYEKEGPEGFRKYKLPTPFDWDSNDPSKRKRVFFDVNVDGESKGRIVVETLDDVLPVTSENFQKLAMAPKDAWLTYKNSGIHRIMKTSALVAGDVEGGSGRASHSALGRRYFEHEGFYVPHSEPGIVSMVSNKRDENGSQFYITIEPCPHLDGRCTAFGRVVEGMDLVQELRGTFSRHEIPVTLLTLSPNPKP
uniref:Peptidyl-prolyl cis-trans isomerase n=1 Tax=Phaeomonas parva TaxID=124430 RepID=A0A7S1U933_9STRA|mmetsp:Transcript_36520/g.114458  ORF Transcript_36520/g.114458 Transcript_36520/m.114458 type:complete len:227 (+) Transcript_36520:95-775(+)